MPGGPTLPSAPPLKGPRRLLGLSSGTSADALDLALIEVSGRGGARRVLELAVGERPWGRGLARRIRAAASASPGELAALHYELGTVMGRLAREFLAEAGVAPAQVAAAGSHGQTVHHHDGDPRGGTLQLGDPALVAAGLGIPVVADFRWSDLAAGGQGAPLSPFADWVRHRRRAPRLAVLNLGGIGNLTLLEGEAPPRAWDTGPANGPLDALARAELGRDRDEDGAAAMRGRVLPGLLEVLRADPWFRRSPPRSTGLERFGAGYLRQVRERAPDAAPEDLLATLVELAAWAVADSLARAGWAGGPVFVAGGGARNPALVAAVERVLGELSAPTTLRSYRELGADPDAREAVAFALLADAFLLGEPASWPATTGVRRPALLGRWVPPPLGRLD